MAHHIRGGLSRRGSIVFAAALGLVLAAPALLTGYQLDDWVQHLRLSGETTVLGLESASSDMFTFADGEQPHTRQLVQLGFLPWWTLDALRLSFWRPITVLTHVLDHMLWPDSYVLMHLHSVLWYVAAVVLAGALYRKMLAPTWAAGLAVLLFAIDDAHAMPAGWLANRGASIALFWGLVALMSHMKWREEGRNEWLTVALFALVMCLLAKESGVAACAYLFAYAVFLDPGHLMTRVISVLPYAGTVFVWRLVYATLGHGIAGSSTYADPLVSPLAFAQQALQRIPVLFLGQWGLPPSDVHVVLPAGGQWLMWAGGAILFLILAATFAPMYRYDAPVGFWALGMGLSLLPLCAAPPADRLLMWPGLGAFGLLAQYLHARSERREMWARAAFARAMAPLVTFVLVVVHIVLAPLLMPMRILAFATLGDAIEEAMATAPVPEDIEERTLVIANAPNRHLTGDFLVVRQVLGQPVPVRIRTLSANCLWPEPHEITRVDDRTVCVRPRNGFQWSLARDKCHPLARGETVDLGDVTVEITALNRRGQPSEVVYQFDYSVNDPRYVWLVYKVNLNQYVPFLPPPVGQTFTIDPYA
ncbi:MAG TPA: hypothetical protein PK166_02770 [Candidatus Hydrogenedentes bacterium]|mgnify:FL=1|nr:hypothetical protein [Candidatus Hydrogenedentota bacterium]